MTGRSKASDVSKMSRLFIRAGLGASDRVDGLHSTPLARPIECWLNLPIALCKGMAALAKAAHGPRTSVPGRRERTAGRARADPRSAIDRALADRLARPLHRARAGTGLARVNRRGRRVAA